MELHELGFGPWFQTKLSQLPPSEYRLARITAVNKDNYLIKNESGEILAEIIGKLRYEADSNLDLPTVGDWVFVQYFDDNTFAIIHQIFPRKSLLKRKMAGKKIEYQLLAANIDTALIIQSLDFDFNLPRLERYLVMVHESHIEPVILLSKADLISSAELELKLSQVHKLNKNYPIIAFSNETAAGLPSIEDLIRPGITHCLLGSSGVGKTTLLNRLLGQNRFATNTVREKDGRGRHTTNQRQLIILNNGGLIIDTPGLRELGNIGVEVGITETFANISELAEQCHFKNCTHTNEPGCAVLDALEKELISVEHYRNYLKLRKESAYYETSWLEKRQRDKRLGKLYKEIMKQHNRRNKNFGEDN